MEELVGRAVRKEFPGFGTYAGIVESYDAVVGYFRVLYEDGDSEEVDLSEMAAILVGCGAPPPPPVSSRGAGRGRRPKKRRRSDGAPVENGGLENGGDTQLEKVALNLENLEGNGGLGASGIKENGVLEDCKDAVDGILMNSCGLDAEEKKEGQSGRKRRRVSMCSDSATPLRRSARQANAAKLAHVEATPSDSVKQRSRANSSKKTPSGNRDCEVAGKVPKLEFPPSSKIADLEGLPVLDLFAVYSCLRSFSRQLFLSPFRLETFVAVLRCMFVNPLIDCIHFSLLQTLKKHLEILSEEGSQSAIQCLRNLNWDLLDLASWPVFLAEYLLVRGSVMRSGMKLARLKLLTMEYYKQPAVVKLELLRFLCDDVLETEAIRTELSSRMTESELNDEAFRSRRIARKRCDLTMKDIGGPSQPQDASDDFADGNSDECYLCGMDGNLICCDGCPAAFHSKCVGVAKDLLPEGDWYCPECLIENSDEFRKLSTPFRGAEVLGIDPHGCLYFSSCGYLLVTDSCDAAAPCHYYGQNDLYSLITMLNMCHSSYSSVTNAICSFWSITIESSDVNGYCENGNGHSIFDTGFTIESSDVNGYCENGNGHSIFGTAANDKHMSLLKEHEKHLSPLEQDAGGNQVKTENDRSSSEQLNPRSFHNSDSSQLNQVSSHQPAILTPPFLSENGDEMADPATTNKISQQISSDAKSGNNDPPRDVVLAAENGKFVGLLGWGGASSLTKRRKAADSHFNLDPASYVNYYSFGRIASSVAQELMHKLSENKDEKKPTEDVISLQLKTICKKYVSFCSSTYQKLSAEMQKEKCGWCNSCKITGGSDCVFRITDDKPVENSKSRTVGLRSEKNKKSHIIAAMHHIISIEGRVSGLLCGPWENPQYSNFWRKAVLKASGVASLKKLLLMLESNIRRIAFSAEWQKPVDSGDVVGSAAHILMGSANTSTSYGSSRKQGKRASAGESKIGSLDVGVFWWRGGRLSRQVFNWKRLPRLLACKGGRQAGCKKIPTISYPDGLETPRRCKYIAWRADVEMSQNVAQLIFLIKELESNIKWAEILGAQPFTPATKESQKLAKLFKKVIIRRKCIDGANVKYLLDFGKRENIPPIVAKHGTKLVESSSERKRYWLSEGHVPLSLLKAYEDKKLTLLLKKKDCSHLPEMTSDCKTKKPKRSEGLMNLMAKARKLGSKLCGHCNQNVPMREAVNCKYCSEIFHRKHFRVPRGATCAGYICNKCKDKNDLEVKYQQKKAALKKAAAKKRHSRDVATKRNHVVVKVKKKAGRKKKSKRGQHRKGLTNKPKNEPVKGQPKRSDNKHKKGQPSTDSVLSWRKRKRTAVRYSYWLDGLHWTPKEDDEQAKRFRKERVAFPSENMECSTSRPVCCLCQKEYNGEAIYIGCEKCEDWFHGDVYCVTLENINNLRGFKCHRCCLRSIPFCPYMQTDEVDGARSYSEGVEGTTQAEDHNSQKELDGTEVKDCPAVEAQTEGFLDEEQFSIRISSKEELIITSETGSMNKTVTLQSLDHAEENSIPAEHEIGLQVAVTS